MFIKININEDKYITLLLNKSGYIEYRITWKEHDNVSRDNITDTYQNIKNTFNKINKENYENIFTNFDNLIFKNSLINSISKLEIPNNKSINHNDLSEFVSFFHTFCCYCRT